MPHSHVSHPAHSSDLERRVHLLEQAISEAAQASSAEPALPSELRDSIARVDRLTDQLRALLQTDDQARLHKLVADISAQADRARRVCANIPHLSAQLRGAVSHVHSQLRELQRDLQ